MDESNVIGNEMAHREIERILARHNNPAADNGRERELVVMVNVRQE